MLGEFLFFHQGHYIVITLFRLAPSSGRGYERSEVVISVSNSSSNADMSSHNLEKVAAPVTLLDKRPSTDERNYQQRVDKLEQAGFSARNPAPYVELRNSYIIRSSTLWS
jgi:hypothetical protein